MYDGAGSELGQLSFDFGAPPPGGLPPDRGGGRREPQEVLFFAVMPPPTIAHEVASLGADLARREGLKLRLHAPDRFHLSLVGWRLDRRTREDSIAAARELGRRITWNSFEVVLTTALSFGRTGARPLVLGCSPGSAWALTGLHDRLLAEAPQVGVHLRGRTAFEPHLTLAYSRTPIVEQPLEMPVRWMASELVLILSEQGRGRHTVVGRWPFHPQG